METIIKNITPDDAERILSKNPMNRNLNKRVVDLYSEEMKSGRWYANGAPIFIDYDGNLKDGQHRLTAIVKSGVTMRNAIIVYLEKADAVCYDIGKVRSTQDTAMLMGINTVNIRNKSIASMITYMLKHLKGFFKLMPKTLVIDVINENEDLCDFVREAYLNKNISAIRGLKIAGITAAIAAAWLNGYNSERLMHICDVLAEGIISDENDIGIIKLRDYLITNKYGTGTDFNNEIYFQMQRILRNHEKNIITKQLGKKRIEYYKIPIEIIPEKYRKD